MCTIEIQAVTNTERPVPVSPWKRLAALFYECFAVIAIAGLATGALLPIMPEGHVPAGSWWYRLYLLAAVGTYFIWCWHRGGQTLAMRAWRLCLVDRCNGSPRLRVAALRYLCALLGWLPLGLGYWWMFIDRERRAWHDLVTGTKVVYVPLRAH